VSSLNSSSNNYFKFMYIYSGNFMLLDYHWLVFVVFILLG
jgi:hypothetical protein